MTQEEALDILKMGHSVFLTGAAGTGKTFVLNKYIHYLKSHSINPIVTASTGIAATHIGGQTIHSWSGIGIYEKLDNYTLDKLEQNEKLYKKYERAKVLIIDEISMLHASKLDMINTLFKKLLKSDKPFAGIQIIFCGDFFQLPPVVKTNFNNLDDKELENKEEKEFAYNSKAWQELNPIICYLEKNYRQEDNKLNTILNDIRFKKDWKNLSLKLKKINKNQTINKKKEILKLYTHNIDVDTINIEKYNLLSSSSKEISYKMQNSGKKNYIESLKQNCLASEVLSLKKGTKVIFIKNDKERKYQNGTLGEVIGFDDFDKPIVETFDGKTICVGEDCWQYSNDEGKVLAEITQIPLRYAWAITVHKSQGMTLDAAEIDLSRAFGTGMGYVALSRVKRLENINLLGLHDNALKINPFVLEQDKLFQKKSINAKKALEKYYLDKKLNKVLKEKQKDFILASGGSIAKIEIVEEKYEKKEKIKTTIITKNFLLDDKFLPEEIAEKRNLTLGTIISHIEELLSGKEINKKDINYISKDLEKNYTKGDIKNILQVLKEDTGLTIKHKKLNYDFNINIDFNTLKLFRIFI